MKISLNTRRIAALTMVVAMSACTVSGANGRPLLSVEFINREPPPPRVEVISERPSQEVVWIGGHWRANGNDYAWVSGHWERPERGRKEWIEGRWEHEDRGWHYIEGHWN